MKKRLFFILLATEILLIILNMILAYIVTPDLSYVAGTWLSEIIGNVWIGETLIVLFRMALVFAWSYYSLFVYKTVYTKKTKFTEYFSFLAYERYDKFLTGIRPKHINHIFAACGFAAPFALIAWRFVITVEWILCVIDRSLYVDFWRFTDKYLFIDPETLASLIGCVTAVIYWYLAEHKNSNKAAEERETIEE